MKTNVLKIVLCSLCSIGLLTGCSASSTSTPQNQSPKEETSSIKDSAAIDTEKTYTAEIVVKDYGTITVALDPQEAPITCENFIDLAKSGFYDGLTFHRIMQGFMIQGGDPNHNGTGGSDVSIKGEFSDNGVENAIQLKRGTIAMARSSHYDSASSQFFICDADDDFLNGQYAGFGHVISGMDVVDQIAEDAEPIDNNGTIKSDDQPIIETIHITESK